jgi:hypothetical protein
MATRLRVKRKKDIRDRATEHKKNPQLKDHKIDNARSKKAQAKKINRAR